MADAKQKKVVIIGAGPAGLTAALELLRHSELKPLVLEADNMVGGISRTVNYKGNRIDIGGHRFFSKSDWVMNWWQQILPLEESLPTGSDSEQVMMRRQRLSRIYFERKFFNYPVSTNIDTALKLGPWRIVRILFSYARSRLLPRRPERSLEDFLINRFGSELYSTFFRDYTEKVWGVPCAKISKEWGAQRIKGLSISSALLHALKAALGLRGKVSHTSLIGEFLYPRLGPGQMWESVTEQVTTLGGEVRLGERLIRIRMEENRVVEVTTRRSCNGSEQNYRADELISTMPVKDLIAAISPEPPQAVRKTASGLLYRDFLTVGLLVEKMKVTNDANKYPRDNWIYIQEPEVRMGRLQIFNNWSPYMVADANKVWIGLEYFCAEGDDLWSMADADLIELARSELTAIDLIDSADVLDGVVIRMPKAYPSYFGTYEQFSQVRDYIDTIDNLYAIGRNGMHRYNNQDHSMLTARFAVKAICDDSADKTKIWEVNIGDDYHEEK